MGFCRELYMELYMGPYRGLCMGLWVLCKRLYIVFCVGCSRICSPKLQSFDRRKQLDQNKTTTKTKTKTKK